MSLTKISINNFRCFKNVDLQLSPGINFFFGKNGSGKTSILESVFIFSSGKSFKSSNLASLVNYENDKFTLKAFDNLKGYIVEIEKNKNKPISVLLNNKKITTSKLIKEFPCTPIHNNTFSFADAAPDFRRKLLDRSIFISEKSFSECWFSYYRSLKQRNSILKNKLFRDGVSINENIIEYVAKNIKTNVRELEGAIISLIAQSSFNRVEIDLELAKEIVNKFVKNTKREVSIDYIQKVVSEYFQMDIATLQSKTRKRHIVQARQLAMYFAKKFTKASLASIGSQIGKRDHATVLHACKTVDNLSFTDKQFRKYVEDLNQKLTL